MQISIFLKNNNTSDFKVIYLENLLDEDKRSIRYYLDKLISLYYINKSQESTFPFDNIYKVTELGKNFVEKLKESYHKVYRRLENDIRVMKDYMNRQNKWRR